MKVCASHKTCTSLVHFIDLDSFSPSNFLAIEVTIVFNFIAQLNLHSTIFSSLNISSVTKSISMTFFHAIYFVWTIFQQFYLFRMNKTLFFSFSKLSQTKSIISIPSFLLLLLKFVNIVNFTENFASKLFRNVPFEPHRKYDQ